ncbi:MAG: formimidoylglutamate deiminase [Euzebyales bacterium]|nr:formimidoylglutamate deiminase [Euzebyales bacterium]
MNRWHATHAWVADGEGRVAHGVLIETDGRHITAVAEDVAPPQDAFRLPGFVIPGLANVHSHAFHRAIRGRTERGDGDFWRWREHMYAVAAGLDPDIYFALARATYAEMALAGITAVGEFHYLHHAADGRPYANPNAMGEVLVAAAEAAGVRITLIDTCYLHGGFGRQLEGPQLRFSDRAADRWAERVASAPTGENIRNAAGIHSVRAVDPDAMRVVAAWAADREVPLHVHVSEQPAENEACLAATGRTPTALLADCGVLGRRTTAVHATHVTAGDIGLLAEAQTFVAMCPTTERNLADGVGPADALVAAGSRLCFGSDSHAIIDLFEEARAVELDERLATGRRGHHRPEALLQAATATGMASLGWQAGRLAPGQLADLVTLDLDSPRLAGAAADDLAAHVVFAAAAADVTHVVSNGRPVIIDRHHVGVGPVGPALSEAIGHALA